MGVYLGVKAVSTKGKFIQGSVDQPYIPTGHRLIMVLNNGLYKIAPDVTDPKEYKYFYEQYSKGYWISFELFLLPEELIKECPDEGRVYQLTHR
jgi:hypothetical protein